ncbi:MAG: GGDEF domain-containing protein [Dyella sp.]
MVLFTHILKPVLRASHHVRVSHFALPLGLLSAAWLLRTRGLDQVDAAAMFAFLPTLLLLLGGALCVVFGRWRQLCLQLIIYASYVTLATHVAYYHEHGTARGDSEPVFLLAAIAMPSVYGIYALWPERGGAALALGLRLGGLGVGWVIAGVLISFHAPALRQLLGTIWWPRWYGAWMHLPQLAYPLSAAMCSLLAIQYLREPRPQHAAQLLVLPSLMGMLPLVFVQPYLLQMTCCAALLALAAAMVHESFHMAFRDELTGLPGRRALSERLQRLRGDYVLAVLDVDHFKRFNDSHGHDVGDQVLRMVAAQLRKSFGGKAYRQGGEEFVIVFEGPHWEDCLDMLEQLRQGIQDYRMHLRNAQQRPSTTRQGRAQRGAGSTGALAVTVSIGAASSDDVEGGPQAILKAADQALYKAKQGGRNRVVPSPA